MSEHSIIKFHVFSKHRCKHAIKGDSSPEKMKIEEEQASPLTPSSIEHRLRVFGMGVRFIVVLACRLVCHIFGSCPTSSDRLYPYRAPSANAFHRK
jgi:hypothetical protein